jgi:hypothetical protein
MPTGAEDVAAVSEGRQAEGRVLIGHLAWANLAGNDHEMPTLVCTECGRFSDLRAEGWHAYLVDLDEDGHDEVALYCPICAAREFGRAAPT